MFDFVRSHTRLMQFLLVLVIFPAFVFVGVEGYRGFREGNATVAKVAGRPITQAEWDNAHRNQVERLRAQSPEQDLKVYDTPQAKLETLEELVRQRVLLVAADKLRLATSDARLQRLFQTDPQLAAVRRPDGSLNTELLAANGLSPQQFEQQLRQDLSMRQVMLGVGGSTLGSAAATDTALDALLQRRQVRTARFEAKDYYAKIKPSDAEIAAHYERRGSDYQAPERASIEYVVLDLDALKAGIKLGEDELRKYYTENAARYTAPEERRARHILFEVKQGASAAERDKVKAEAEAVLAELKKDPGRFAALAKQHSDDPGSAAKGGDLDFFARGAMVKPFEDAAYALGKGELSGIVQSDFGYHIIQLTDVRGGERKPFEAVRAEIEAEVKQQLAQRRYAEAAETFSNMAYEQSDSLKPVADKLGLELRSAKAVTRTPAQGAQGPLANPKFLAAVFTDDVIRNKRNSETVDLGGNRLAAARITDHAPARQLPLDDVKELVRQRVIAEQAAEMARKDGEAKLAAWRDGAPAPALQPAVTVSRNEPQNLPDEVVEAILAAPAAQLPAWVGSPSDAGYVVARIEQVLPRTPTPEESKRLQAQYAQVLGAAEAEAYYELLKARYKAQITATAKDAAALDGSSPR